MNEPGAFQIVAVFFHRKEQEYAKFKLIPIVIGMRELHFSCSLRCKLGDKCKYFSENLKCTRLTLKDVFLQVHLYSFNKKLFN